MRRSGIREVMDLAAGMSDVLHLEVGEPDFPTPRHIVEAGVAAAKAAIENNRRQEQLQGAKIERALAGDEQAKAEIQVAQCRCEKIAASQ